MNRAKKIEDPWYSCQAISYIARFSETNRLTNIKTAIQKAFESNDPYRKVAACAWPVRAAVETNLFNEIKKELSNIISSSNLITLKVSRSEALFLLFQAVYDVKDSISDQIIEKLFDASFPMIHWRQRRNLRDTMSILHKYRVDKFNELMPKITDEKLLNQLKEPQFTNFAHVKEFFH